MITAEISETENKKKKSNREKKSVKWKLVFEMISATDKALARLIRKKKTHMEWERWHHYRLYNVKRKIRKYDEQLYSNTFDDLDEANSKAYWRGNT